MLNKIQVEKRDLDGLFNTIKCLTDQVLDEQKNLRSVRDFWSKKYSIIKFIILECKDDKDISFIKKHIKNNTLTEETWSSYKRRKKTSEPKENKTLNKDKSELPLP